MLTLKIWLLTMGLEVNVRKARDLLILKCYVLKLIMCGSKNQCNFHLRPVFKEETILAFKVPMDVSYV